MNIDKILKRMRHSRDASKPYIDQPNVEDTISILRGLRERFEIHHGVNIRDEALVKYGGSFQPLYFRPIFR